MTEELVTDQRNLSDMIIGFQKAMLKTAKDKTSVGWFKTQLDQLEGHWTEFYDAHKIILRSKGVEAVTKYIDDEVYSITNTQYALTKTTILNVLAPGRNQSTIEGDRDYENVSFEPNFKSPLPIIQLPKFSGQQLEWETFKGMFVALVHDAPRIAPILKLQYLLTSCTGEAAAHLKNVQVTGDNYTSVWQSMLDKYNDKRALVSANMHNVSSCPPANKRSIEEINRVLAVSRESHQAFKNLKIPAVNLGDLWLVHHTVQKLDAGTRMDWEKEVDEMEEEYPSFDSLAKFLGRYVKIIAKAQPGGSKPRPLLTTSDVQGPKAKGTKGSHTHVVSTDKAQVKKGVKSCTLCKGQHFIAYCDRYKNLDFEQRLELIQQNNLCSNCLKRNHSPTDCRSGGRCFVCQDKHHSSLHGADMAVTPRTSPSNIATSQSSTTTGGPALAGHVDNSDGVTPTSSCLTASLQAPVLLATALVILQSPNGRSVTARALLDQGAEFSLVTERIVQLLGLKQVPVQVPILGIGEISPGRSSALVTMTLRSPLNQNFQLPLEALVLKKLTSRIPTMQLSTATWEHIRGLQLADPDYGTPSSIDCILGAEVYGRLLLGGLRRGNSWEPIAQETSLGWVLSGSTQQGISPSKYQQPTTVNHVTSCDTLQDALQAFWKVEEPPAKMIQSPSDQICESLFRSTFQLDSDTKRITVSLPFKADPPILGESRGIATACWLRLESKFKREPQLASLYHHFMQEYLSLHHMEEITEEPDSSRSYYIPHHGIIKRHDGQSKIRVVFNASQKTTNGQSLNDQLFAGSKLQVSVWLVMTLWRFFCVGATADIIKMFRQFLVAFKDTNYQLIVYRERSDIPLKVFRLLTVTYGTTPAPYLALRVLLELANRYQDRYPRASAIVRRNRYVDDFFFGADTPEEALELRRELEELLSLASLSLDKWASNVKEVLPKRSSSSPDNLSVFEESVSTLGLVWNTNFDCLRYQARPISIGRTITKRTILSEVARLYDPLGWISPVIIIAKVLLQDLWLSNVTWDDPVPDDLGSQWRAFVESLPELELIQIPRYIGYHPNTKLELHGFSDASQRAFAACVYIVVRSNQGASSSLVMAKSKVAPLNTLSIPRLELCGAHLLARLMKEILDALRVDYEITPYCWTDAQIVLYWLAKHPSSWATFIATRTSAILELLPSLCWQHVKSSDNPADLATRGCSAGALSDSQLWWKGPSFLLDQLWPCPQPLDDPDDDGLERRAHPKFGGNLVFNEDYTLKFSSYRRLQRVTALCLRAVTYKRAGYHPNFKPYLTVTELRHARDFLVKQVQAEHYSPEIENLQASCRLPTISKLIPLRPFLDNYGILRVGGRLKNAMIAYNEKFPIILPKDAHLSWLIVMRAHLDTLHGAQQLTLSHVDRNYWIVHGRSLVHSVIKSCVRCARFSAKPQHQLMGDLPAARVTASPPFKRVGVDYVGPVSVRTSVRSLP